MDPHMPYAQPVLEGGKKISYGYFEEVDAF